MKKILLSQRLLKSDKGEIFESLAVSWGALFSAAGFIPVPLAGLLPPSVALDEIDCSGILLSGGNDLSAVNNDPLSELRDSRERLLVDEALRRKLPILGVCRGAQFLAHYFGSTLAPARNHAGTRHTVIFDPAPLVGITERISREVNSYHNWAIDAAPAPLAVTGRTEDGSIESFIHREQPLAGIMWHPEREDPFIEQDIHLLKSFFSS